MIQRLITRELGRVVGRALVAGARYAYRKLFAEPEGEPHPKTHADVERVRQQIAAGTSHGVVPKPKPKGPDGAL